MDKNWFDQSPGSGLIAFESMCPSIHPCLVQIGYWY